MTSTTIEPADMLGRLNRKVKDLGSQAEFARRAGVSEAYVSLVMSGHRLPSARLLRALGLVERTVYLEVHGSNA